MKYYKSANITIAQLYYFLFPQIAKFDNHQFASVVDEK